MAQWLLFLGSGAPCHGYVFFAWRSGSLASSAVGDGEQLSYALPQHSIPGHPRGLLTSIQQLGIFWSPVTIGPTAGALPKLCSHRTT